MSLRNKKTGEISTNSLISVAPYTNNVRGCHIKTYQSIGELNKEWEDVEDINVTNIPLIEDEKIRECVKLWTELNGYGHSLMYAEGNNWGDVWCSFYEPLDDEELLFRNRRCTNLQDRKIYAITELCGNSKEEE